MTKSSEAGHISNLNNFDRLLTVIASRSDHYRPSRASLSLEALQNLHTAAKNAFVQLKKADSEYATAIDVRKNGYSTLGPYITRIINALIASDSSEEADRSAKILVRKLRGQRVSAFYTDAEKAALESEGKSSRQHSSSQMDFNSRLDNFDKLVCLLAVIPEYNPNEDDLKVGALKAYYHDLYAKNLAVIEAASRKANAHTNRFDILYKPLSGMVPLALDAKTYIKSIEGSSGLFYKLVSKIKFTNLSV